MRSYPGVPLGPCGCCSELTALVPALPIASLSRCRARLRGLGHAERIWTDWASFQGKSVPIHKEANDDQAESLSKPLTGPTGRDRGPWGPHPGRVALVVAPEGSLGRGSPCPNTRGAGGPRSALPKFSSTRRSGAQRCVLCVRTGRRWVGSADAADAKDASPHPRSAAAPTIHEGGVHPCSRAGEPARGLE